MDGKRANGRRNKIMEEEIRKWEGNKKMDWKTRNLSSQRAGPQKPMENHRKSIGSGRLPEEKIRKTGWETRKWKQK